MQRLKRLKADNGKETMTQQITFFDQTKETWLRLARMEALRIVNTRGEVCADDLHKALPIPKYIDGRIMGCVFIGLKFDRYKKSERTECHHRPIGVFVMNGNQC
jgi:hypothetical protein